MKDSVKIVSWLAENVDSDVLSSIFNCLTALAAMFVAYAAWKGVDAWKRELSTTRHLNLAEQVLGDFYKAHDIMKWVRSPFCYEGEGKDRPEVEGESEHVKQYREVRFVAIERLKEQSDYFGEMQRRKYRVIATFGEAAAKPYKDFFEQKRKVEVASSMLSQHNPEEADDRDLWRDLEKDIGWCASNEDTIGEAIDKIVEDVEEIFRPIIDKAAR